MEDERAVTHELEESSTIRCRLLIGLVRVLLSAEADHSGSAGLSDEAFLVVRVREQLWAKSGASLYQIRFRSPNSCQR
jgi:hypothetical protein